MHSRIILLLLLLACVGVAASFVPAQATARAAPGDVYDPGAPILHDIWVDPVTGNDSATGSSRTQAVRTLVEAWNRIPQGEPLSQHGYRIRLVAGTYPEAEIPVYFESRYGTYQHPITIESADGPRAAVLQGDLNIFDTRYLYLLGLLIRPDPPGDALHCERCDHLLLWNSELDGGTWRPDGGAIAWETFKANQSSHLYLENNDIHGAADNALDFVAVQYGHLLGNRIHHARDWCGYVKGGSSSIWVDGNEFFDCGTGGFTVGQGSGFQFLAPPWLHYEGYDVRVVNNIVHDTIGAGLGVNGGYNVLLAHNTLYRVGSRSHTLEVVLGGRSCDGSSGDPDRTRCADYLAAGGWGTTRVDNGDNYVRIPNKHVYVYNNLIYNPQAYRIGWQIFAIGEPYGGIHQAGSNAPSPALADEDLRIRGNLIWTGDAADALGVDDGGLACGPTNVTCNVAQLRRDNTINSIEPELLDFARGYVEPATGGNLFDVPTFPIPAFPGGDQPSRPPVPVGTLVNTIPVDFHRSPRSQPDPPGAFSGASALAHRVFLPSVVR
jgi:hypothetical protein